MKIQHSAIHQNQIATLYLHCKCINDDGHVIVDLLSQIVLCCFVKDYKKNALQTAADQVFQVVFFV